MSKKITESMLVVLTGLFFIMYNPNHGAKKSGVHNISVEQLKKMMKNKDFTLVNVHIPYAGEIPDTDVFIPFNEIEKEKNKLPADKNSKIVLYCRSGNMSAIASKTLVDMGYTSVYDVTGGMRAWKSTGYQLLDKSNK